MKLSPEQIGTIEALLTLRERGVSNTEIARRLEVAPFGPQKVSAAFIVLDTMGLPVSEAKHGRPFRKTAKVKTKPKAARQKSARGSRVFLSADQWQERLSAMGH